MNEKPTEEIVAELEAATRKSRALTKWADPAMYDADPMPPSPWGKGQPRVRLLGATADPLGVLAAFCAMYKGRVVRTYEGVSDEDRTAALEDLLKTALQGPLEVIRFHFLIEGVTRSWTHQAVRTRSAFFAQESLRFAVKDSWVDDIAPPLSVRHDIDNRRIWEAALESAEDGYAALIDRGVPAEDARGLLPTAVRTRLHMSVDYRTLLHLAGLRLCTQAEFEWRSVMAGITQAVREYRSPGGVPGEMSDSWQFRALSEKLLPICYQTGRCGFMASFDRGCKIRDRVEANARINRPSGEWDTDRGPDGAVCGEANCEGCIPAINKEEWLLDPTAARSGR